MPAGIRSRVHIFERAARLGFVLKQSRQRHAPMARGIWCMGSSRRRCWTQAPLQLFVASPSSPQASSVRRQSSHLKRLRVCIQRACMLQPACMRPYGLHCIHCSTARRDLLPFPSRMAAIESRLIASAHEQFLVELCSCSQAPKPCLVPSSSPS